MYSIYSASGRFGTKLFQSHQDAYAAFRASKAMGIAYVVNEHDGVIEYDLISDGVDSWCYKHDMKNRRATAQLSA